MLIVFTFHVICHLPRGRVVIRRVLVAPILIGYMVHYILYIAICKLHGLDEKNNTCRPADKTHNASCIWRTPGSATCILQAKSQRAQSQTTIGSGACSRDVYPRYMWGLDGEVRSQVVYAIRRSSELRGANLKSKLSESNPNCIVRSRFEVF